MQIFEIEAEHEFQFDVEEDEIKIELIEGVGEILGIKLKKNRTYTFKSGVKAAIFTYHGCKLKVESRNSVFLVSENNPIVSYTKFHEYLNVLRKEASIKKKKGPVVLVCGSKAVGKSLLSKILLNYAFDDAYKPIYVELNCGQGLIGIPGTIGYFVMKGHANIELDYDSLNSYDLNLGDKSPMSIPNLYLTLIKQLSFKALEEFEDDPLIKKSGIIINTSGWVTDFGYESLIYAIKAFKVNVIITIDDMELNKKLENDLNFLHILNMPKSTGILWETASERIKKRLLRIDNYFYNYKSKDEVIPPYIFDISFDDLDVYEITYIEGQKDDINSFELEKVKPSKLFSSRILIVIPSTNLKKVLRSSMNNYICVKSIHLENESITVISRQPKAKIIDSSFILTKIKYSKNFLMKIDQPKISEP